MWRILRAFPIGKLKFESEWTKENHLLKTFWDIHYVLVFILCVRLYIKTKQTQSAMKIRSLRLSRICYHVMFLEFSSVTRRLQSVKKWPFREIFSWKVFDLPQVWIFTKWSSYWTHGHGRKGPIKFLGIASLYFRGCAWQPDLLKKKKYSRKNVLKVGFFWIWIPLKFWSLNKSHFLEKLSSWNIGQNAI